jgi:hypothetical protein
MRIVAFVGLTLNCIGTILVWIYGLPANINREGDDVLMMIGKDLAMKKKAKQFVCISNCGMGLILLGFVLQAIAVFCL